MYFMSDGSAFLSCRAINRGISFGHLGRQTTFAEDHALTTIAQIRVCLALSYGGPMAPATGATRVRCFRDRSARFACPFNLQVTQDKELLQFFPANFCRYIRVRFQYHGRFQRVADQLLLARTLDGLPNYGPQF